MAIVADPAPSVPTNLAPLPRLLAYAQSLGLERHLDRPGRGIPTLALALVWPVLAWRGSGRPDHADQLDEPLLAALLGRSRLPCARTPRRGLARFSARGARAAVEAAYLAELPRRAGRIWVAVGAHQVPYWGRGKLDRFLKGWSGRHSRRPRGYRLYLAVDTETGQIITYLLARGRMRDARLLPALARHLRRLLGRRLAGVVADSGFTSKAAVAALIEAEVRFILGFRRTKPVRAALAELNGHQRRWLRERGATGLGARHWGDGTRLIALAARTPTDRRGPWVYVTDPWGSGPQRLARLYRQRWRVEQVLDELVNGHDLDHLVGYRLAPNRVAGGLRLPARNLAIGLQIREAGQRPATIREPLACRATQVDGLGTFVVTRDTLVVTARHPPPGDDQPLALPWTNRLLRYAA
jgi:hypothetical protein